MTLSSGESACYSVDSEMVGEWNARAEFLRRVGGKAGAWSTEGHLVHLEFFGPVTASEATPETQPSITPQERERREREARRDIASRASGGPVPRLSAENE